MKAHPSSLSERKRYGLVEGLTSIIINAVLFGIKAVVGITVGSIAVIADATHTFSDTLTSLVLVFGYRVASKPPDSEHPFGHGRAEEIATLVIGVLLGVVGFEIAKAGYERAVSATLFAYDVIVVYVLVASAFVKLALGVWAFALGSRHGSRAIVGDAYHHIADALSSALVAAALYIGGNEHPWLDGALAVALSAVILFVAARLTYGSISALMGSGPSKEELEEITRVAEKAHPLVKRVHHVHLHRYGDHVEVTLHIELPGDISLADAHEIATSVENEVRKKLGYEATVHVEPGASSENHVD